MNDEHRADSADVNAALFRRRAAVAALVETLQNSSADRADTDLEVALRELDEVNAELLAVNRAVAEQHGRSFAAKIGGGDVDLYVSAAILGMVRAIDAYRPDQEIPFSSWAWKPMLRELLKTFRDARGGNHAG